MSVEYFPKEKAIEEALALFPCNDVTKRVKEDMAKYIDASFNSGIHAAWRLINAEKHAQERKAELSARKHDIETQEEASYAAAILERVAEQIKDLKRGENGTSKDS